MWRFTVSMHKRRKEVVLVVSIREITYMWLLQLLSQNCEVNDGYWRNSCAKSAWKNLDHKIFIKFIVRNQSHVFFYLRIRCHLWDALHDVFLTNVPFGYVYITNIGLAKYGNGLPCGSLRLVCIDVERKLCHELQAVKQHICDCFNCCPKTCPKTSEVNDGYWRYSHVPNPRGRVGTRKKLLSTL